jgi:hypothetical protein
MTKKNRIRSSKATRKQVNKSAAIRDYLAKDPNGRPQGIARALGDQGIDVTAAFVSQVKLKMKQSGGLPSKRRNNSAGIAQFASADLMEAKRLIDKIGVEKALAAVELVARLS